jgi:hypothetical protein
MVAVGYHKRAGLAQQKGRRRNAETPMRPSDAPFVHAPFEGGRDIPRSKPNASRAERHLIAPDSAPQVFAAPMSLNSTPPFALSSLADSTIVIVTALGSTL